MSHNLIQIDSTAELRSRAPAWDDLWRRSTSDRPSAKAALVAQCADLTPGKCFRALAVEQAGQWVAALPLVAARLARLFSVGRLPSAPWSWGGDLLLDPAADIEPTLDALVAGFRRLPWPLVWSDAVAIDSAAWRQLFAALVRAGLAPETNAQFRIGRIAVSHDWQAYQRGWPRSHRKEMRQALARAGREGGCELDIRRRIAPEEIDELLNQGFEVEHRGWKGEGGTSVQAAPGALAFFRSQARLLAAAGELQLAYLLCGGTRVAFEYGWRAKSAYLSLKAGYDESFAALSPGHLLRYMLLERLFSEPDCRGVDFLGPLTSHLARWSTESYRVGRFVAPTGGPASAALLGLYRNGWVRARALRDRYRRRPADREPQTVS